MNQNADCTFPAKNGIFNYRVGAIIRHDGRFLMAHNPAEDVYYSVGGRVRLFETLEQALKREVEEETGIGDFESRLFALHENFFGNVHEISVFFEITDAKDLASITNGHLTKDGPAGERLVWLEADDLKRANVFPDFLAGVDFSDDSGAVHHFLTLKEED